MLACAVDLFLVFNWNYSENQMHVYTSKTTSSERMSTLFIHINLWYLNICPPVICFCKKKAQYSTKRRKKPIIKRDHLFRSFKTLSGRWQIIRCKFFLSYNVALNAASARSSDRVTVGPPWCYDMERRQGTHFWPGHRRPSLVFWPGHRRPSLVFRHGRATNKIRLCGQKGLEVIHFFLMLNTFLFNAV